MADLPNTIFQMPGQLPKCRPNSISVLSMGWGVQSMTIAVMAALGDIPKPDMVIHADTKSEGTQTYKYINHWSPWLISNGINVITVVGKHTSVGVMKDNGIIIPAYTSTPSHNRGQLRRQCTGRWKIAPIRRYLQSVRNGKEIDLLMGISIDEYQRMKDSDVKYISNRYPLIDLHISRKSCKSYLLSKGIEIPPKSSCIFCPYHSNFEWKEIYKSDVDYSAAINIDNNIRHARPPYELFLHRNLKPLQELDFRSEIDKGQIPLFDNECSGYCEA
jgi:hypothetical protein